MPAQCTPGHPFNVIAVGPEPTIFSPPPSPFTFFFKRTDGPFSSLSSSLFKPDATPNCTLLTTRNQKRRRPSCRTDPKRYPKKGDENYVKRPENAFILFRSKCQEYRRREQVEWVNEPGKKQRQADISKAIGRQWKSLTTEERHYWEELAKDKKKEHEEKYPDYVYRPRRSRNKNGRQEKHKVKGIQSKYENDTIFPSQTPILHYSNHLVGLNLVPVPQDFCQGSGFEATLQANESFGDMYTTNNEPAQGRSAALPPCNTIPNDFMLQGESMFPSQLHPASGQICPAKELSATYPVLFVSDFECRPDIECAAAQAQIAGLRAEVSLQDTLPLPLCWNHISASTNDGQMPVPAQEPTALSYEFIPGQDAHANSQQVIDSAPRFNDITHDFWLPPFTNPCHP